MFSLSLPPSLVPSVCRRLQGMDLSPISYENTGTIQRRYKKKPEMAASPLDRIDVGQISLDNLGYLNVGGSRGSFVEGVVEAGVRMVLFLFLFLFCVFLYQYISYINIQRYQNSSFLNVLSFFGEKKDDFVATIPRPRSIRDSILDDDDVTALKIGEVLFVVEEVLLYLFHFPI